MAASWRVDAPKVFPVLPKPGKAIAAAIASTKTAKAAAPAAAAVAPASDANEEAPSEVASNDGPSVAVTPVPADAALQKISGADLARRANEEARASGSFVRSSLGGGSLLGFISPQKPSAAAAPAANAAAPAATTAVETPKAQVAVKIINAPKPEAEAAPAASAAAALSSETPVKEAPAKIQTAALGAGTKAAASPAPAAQQASSKCRVWTASYGGGRAIIIKASADATTNYTVLDVNEGTEKREAEAYISAYAKGGLTVGEFNNQTQALDKAFELCPEG